MLKRIFYAVFIFAFIFMINTDICRAEESGEVYPPADAVSGGALSVSDTDENAIKHKNFPYKSYEMYKGETLRIRFNDLKNVIKWKSDNKKVAAVKKGYVSALKKGTAVITAYTKDAVYSMDIKVLPAKKSVIYLKRTTLRLHFLYLIMTPQVKSS